MAGLEEAARRPGRRRGLVAGAPDEIGQVGQGTATAGVRRHYLGCAGKVANGITTVHLSYVREKTGHALAGAWQQIPREHPGDPARSRAMGLPPDLVFRTKGQLATGICDAWLGTVSPRHWLLIRRHRATGELAFHYCHVPGDQLRCRTDTQAAPPATPGQPPPADPGMIPLTVPEIRRLPAALLLRPWPPGHAAHWLDWPRRHQARSRWPTSERTSLATPRSPRSVSDWLLSY